MTPHPPPMVLEPFRFVWVDGREEIRNVEMTRWQGLPPKETVVAGPVMTELGPAEVVFRFRLSVAFPTGCYYHQVPP